MTLKLVSATKPSFSGRPKAKQFPFVENPACVILIPINLGQDSSWWSHDGILLGGIKVNSIEKFGPNHVCRIAYLPHIIPKSWGQQEFGLVLEYEAAANAKFKFKAYYGCGDPSELHLGETEPLVGKAGEKRRIRFKLEEKYISRNELFRTTIEVLRSNPKEVLIYGAWLELHID